jgi:L-ascorbate metabolism protein UlaG (beta-lactamase superfamily)
MNTAILALFLTSLSAAAPVTKLTFHGHAAFEIVTPKGTTLFVDPWLKNPSNPAAKSGDPVAAVKRADYILLTHGHGDHVGDSLALAKKTKAQLVTNPELGKAMVAELGFPKEQASLATLGNAGGELSLAGGDVRVTFTQAVHSSGLDVGEGKGPVYGGNPLGFVIRVKDGPTIYHTGDTAFFKDMEQLASFDVDVALLNIGGHFGMEPESAAMAARVINPRLVIPHHYKTFPLLAQDEGPFFKELDGDKIAHREMAPGQTLEFEGRELKK